MNSTPIRGKVIYFPFKPYDCQIGMVQAILAAISKGENCLIESPTGSGKSQSIFSGVLDYIKSNQVALNVPNEPTVFFLTRTNKQCTQALVSARNFFSGFKISSSVLCGKKYLCVSDCRKPLSDIEDLCKQLRQNKKCPYYENFLDFKKFNDLDRDHSLQSFLDSTQDELISKCIKMAAPICPYYLNLLIFKYSNICFAPYNYFLDSSLKTKINLQRKGKIIIFDEAHNLETICSNVNSPVFDCKELMNSCKKLNLIVRQITPLLLTADLVQLSAAHQQLLSFFKQAIQWMKSYLSPTLVCAGQKTAGLKICVDGTNVINANRPYNEYNTTDAIKNLTLVKSYQGSNILSTTGLLIPIPLVESEVLHLWDQWIQFWSAYLRNPMNYKFQLEGTFSNDTKQDLQQLLIDSFCCSTVDTFKSSMDGAKSIILVSATMPFVKLLQLDLGIVFNQKYVTKKSFCPKNFKLLIADSDFEGRPIKVTYHTALNKNLHLSIANFLIKFCENICGGVLCFLPSYDLLEAMHRSWNETNIEQKFTKCLFWEDRSGSNFEQKVDNYKSQVNIGKGAIFLCVHRAKMSEGINLPDAYSRAVVSIGIPYPNQNSNFKIKAKVDFLKKTCGESYAKEWIEFKAFEPIVQALGRGIRHKEDSTLLVLLDERFLTNNACNSQYIPMWMQSGLIKCGTSDKLLQYCRDLC